MLATTLVAANAEILAAGIKAGLTLETMTSVMQKTLRISPASNGASTTNTTRGHADRGCARHNVIMRPVMSFTGPD